MTVRAGIIGTTGYTGADLLRILSGHPEVEVAKAASRSNGGRPVSDAHPHLKGFCDIKEEEQINPTDFGSGLDVAFLALPHGTSAAMVPDLLASGCRVIDLGADFRLKDRDVYENWYQVSHPCPGYLPEAVYGLTEIYREKVREADIVANPGCYPTSILLGLAPLGGMIKGTVIIDSKSGMTGAGKNLSKQTHFPEMSDNFTAYKIGAHRHTAEIEQEVALMTGGEEEKILFTPHLVPMNRGMLSTIYVQPGEGMDLEKLRKIYLDFYADSFFVRVRDEIPQTKWVRGTNMCDIAVTWNERTETAVIVSAIDNLVKGAAGQAVQNMNVMFGIDEKAGLGVPGLCP